ncbi:hypothetical protein KFU94_11610 [Chloroflexi bacterium TSY]|nr:hypothetical protein [Chloroflexi bacterium TSY]
MAILQLVDQLSDMLNQGKDVPLSRYRMVDAVQFGQLLERMRINVPSSIRESERTLAERDKILAAAHTEAQRIIHEAELRAHTLLSEESFVKMARQEAERIIAEAQAIAQQRSVEADDYAKQVLADLSEKLKTITQQVDNGIQLISQ